ncbi:hypothetical protein B0H15DRAFT_1004874 [Mycena belliarum]|uniref:Uncharacterized protein n=1 Tax=Mycena belliarum TaxID=1033014 RepID=A0AAD6XTH8_9AGAR|nr:hypothetical protein B0H15DRAFT_1004874 [Mycena belliae]
MSDLFSSNIQRSKDTKWRPASLKRSLARQAPTPTPTISIDLEEANLRKYALKRSSVEKAFHWLPTSSPVDNPESGDEYDAPGTNREPALVLPSEDTPRRSALKRPAEAAQLALTRTSIYTLSALELPQECETRTTFRVSVDERRESLLSINSTASIDSRYSCASTASSTDSDSDSAPRPRRRAIPRFCASLVAGTYTLLKDALTVTTPMPDAKSQRTIAPIPMIHDGHKRRGRLPPAFSALATGEQRVRFVCPSRVPAEVCSDPL